MKVSLNTIKQFIDFELPPTDELVTRINQQLGGVDEVIDLGARYKDAVIVKVVSVEKHSGADRLNVCKVDDGGAVKGVERDEDSHVQVVCGAPNVHADMWAVWLPPNATVPASYGTDEPFVLTTRDLRGVSSNGMLAAGDELGINSDHEGIVELTEQDLPPQLGGRGLATGQDFAEAFGLDDTIIDIENKMFTHRPDLFGHLGIAREIAGILGHKFISPKWYLDPPKFVGGSGLKLNVFNDAGDAVPRVMFVAMKNIEVKPSPLWLQCALVAMGSKAINNIIDVTNYAMLLFAQPTHAYDYDKLRGHKIGARRAVEGEKLPLLNGKTYTLTKDDIVIADGEGAIGLGGIMGGANSEVSADTKNIVLEVATFDMYLARKSSMRHGLFTDALTRFNKGQSPLQNDHVMSGLMMSMADVSPAAQASDVCDMKNFKDADDELFKNRWTRHDVASDFINTRLGTKLSSNQMTTMLQNVEFIAERPDEDMVSVTAPFWRTDIEQSEDIVEEIGRLYGFDKFPSVLPLRPITPPFRSAQRQLTDSLRTHLAKNGANEVLTYSFVHENLLKKADQDPTKAFRLSNALSPDLQYYRLSVLPSLLDKVHANIKLGFDEFALFEIGKAHHNQEFDNDKLPREFDRLAAVYARKTPSESAPYFMMRRIVDDLLAQYHFSYHYQVLSEFDFADHDMLRQMAAPFDLKRSAILVVGDTFGGIVGELKPTVARGFKLPKSTAACELFLSFFAKNQQPAHYTPLSRFPSTSRDISLTTDMSVSYATVYQAVQQKLAAFDQAIATELVPIGIYHQLSSDEKTTTFRITLTHHERTFTDDDVAPLMSSLAELSK